VLGEGVGEPVLEVSDSPLQADLLAAHELAAPGSMNHGWKWPGSDEDLAAARATNRDMTRLNTHTTRWSTTRQLAPHLVALEIVRYISF
jgi:hypothetical protein